MKVLLLNGSMHKDGTTYAALEEAAKILQMKGIETGKEKGIEVPTPEAGNRFNFVR